MRVIWYSPDKETERRRASTGVDAGVWVGVTVEEKRFRLDLRQTLCIQVNVNGVA